MGNGSIHLFNVQGHSVSISFTYLFLVLLYLTSFSSPVQGAVFVFAVTFSILWHEFGHAFAFQRFNCGPSDIVLHGFGGHTLNPFGGRLPRGQAMFVSAAGPLAGLALGLPLLGALIGINYYVQAPIPPLAYSLLKYLVYVNIIWSIFNLLPIWPMDGGMIFRQFISKWSKRSYFYTGWLSLIIVAPLIALSVFFREPFMAVIFAMFAFQSFQIIQSSGPGREI